MLNIYDFADFILVDLVIVKAPLGEWRAFFGGCSLYSDDGDLEPIYGMGNTPDEAVRSYAVMISNQKMKRFENGVESVFGVPKLESVRR